MAKKTKEAASLADFSEENLLDNLQDADLEEGEESTEKEEEEEEKPKPLKKTSKKEPEAEEEEEDEADEEEEEEEQEEEEIEDEGEDPSEFWKKVDQLTGVPVEVEYGEIDPLSPQGVALREKALIERSVEDFIGRLQEQYPGVYEALEYAHAGGNIEDLYKGGKDYSKIEIQEEDIDHARLILEDYYNQKGITNAARVKRMIAADEESEEGLVKTAQLALQELKEAQEAERQEEIEVQKQMANEQKIKDQRFVKSLNDLISAGKLAEFQITNSKDATEFSNFVRSHVQRDGKGGYMFVTPVDPANLERQLQAEYFKFKGGNLENLVITKAQSLKARELRLKLNSQEKKKKTSKEEGSNAGSLKNFER